MFNERYIARFWANTKIKRGNACWEWQRKLTSHGYGSLKVKGKDVRTHRFSYLLNRGEIPKGMCVCHTCDNRSCINPSHLFLGTNIDNIKDRHKKGRTSHKSRNVGEKHGLSILTPEIVREIRKRYEDGEKQVSIAFSFNLKKGTVWAAIHKNWSHVSH